MAIRRFSEHRSELLEQQPENGLALAGDSVRVPWGPVRGEVGTGRAQIYAVRQVEGRLTGGLETRQV